MIEERSPRFQAPTTSPACDGHMSYDPTCVNCYALLRQEEAIDPPGIYARNPNRESPDNFNPGGASFAQASRYEARRAETRGRVEGAFKGATEAFKDMAGATLRTVGVPVLWMIVGGLAWHLAMTPSLVRLNVQANGSRPVDGDPDTIATMTGTGTVILSKRNPVKRQPPSPTPARRGK